MTVIELRRKLTWNILNQGNRRFAQGLLSEVLSQNKRFLDDWVNLLRGLLFWSNIEAIFSTFSSNKL